MATLLTASKPLGLSSWDRQVTQSGFSATRLPLGGLLMRLEFLPFPEVMDRSAPLRRLAP
jgi:hypothetical protein